MQDDHSVTKSALRNDIEELKKQRRELLGWEGDKNPMQDDYPTADDLMERRMEYLRKKEREQNESAPIILPDGTKIRGSRKPRYDKVVHFLKRLSLVASKGDAHYSPRSWQRGNGEFIIDTINHAIEHIHKGIEGDSSEDHWAHAAFNCLMLDWFQVNKPEMMRELREKKELPPEA